MGVGREWGGGVAHVTNFTSFRIRATRRMRRILTTRITLALLFVVAMVPLSAIHACDATPTPSGFREIRSRRPAAAAREHQNSFLKLWHAAAHQVEVEVHVGPGDAGDAVEPEA